MWFNQINKQGLAAFASLGILCSIMAACENAKSISGSTPLAPPTAAETQPGIGQELFTTPDDAVVALLDAVRADDHSELKKIFGPQGQELVSGDPVQDAASYKDFADKTAQRAQIEERSIHVAILHIGKDDWSFPIPIVKAADGKWYFDTAEGKNEILARRIGANELETISLEHAYVNAQRDYASDDRDGDEVLQYAQHVRSSPGKKDGLYWETAADELESPLGPLVAQATSEGYLKDKPETGKHPFHGYYYHILTAQGPAAPGGKYNYIINGRMIAGFALISWPDEYGKSGIMTFVVNHQGKVFQKDLGPDTATLASKITEYNPDSSWTLVK